MPVPQINVEYFFRLLYDCFRGACQATGSAGGYVWLEAFVANLWLWIVYVGYLLSVIGLFVIVYAMVRIFALRKREEHYYGTLLVAPDASGAANPRWKRIEQLAAGASPSEWREAIIEADIMLEDVLTRQGYTGVGVGEKLRAVDRAGFDTLSDAWEAHKVRNQIAHEGSAFDLSETLARRTLAHYEAVFREFGVA